MLLERADAEIISLCKWDERRLAFDIKGNKRGVYFLTYFKATASKMQELERACNLSEELLRSMIIRADDVPAEQMEAAEGRAQLADEIKMRGEQSEERTSDAGTSSVTKRSETDASKPEQSTEKPTEKPEPVASGAETE